LSPGFWVKSRWIFGAEPLHDHGFAHAAVAEDRNRRHAGRPAMNNQTVQVIERLLRPWIKHPTLRKNGKARYSPGTAIVDLSKADSPRLRALALVSRSVMRALTVRQFGGGKPSARQRVRIS